MKLQRTRNFWRQMLFGMFIVVLCAGFGITWGGSVDAAKGKPYAGTKIRFLAGNHNWTELLRPYFKEFTERTGIEIEFESLPEEQLSTKLAVECTSRSKSLDVFMFRPLQEGRLFMKNGWLQEIDGLVQKDKAFDLKDFIPSTLEVVQDKDKIAGVPIVTEREILYYRKDIFKKYKLNPPKTLDELMATAKRLNDPNNGIYGFVARGQRAAAVTQFSSYLRGFGADFMKDGKATINTPEAIKAFQFYGDILRNYGAPGVLNMNWPQAAGVFAQGKAAMYTDADSLYRSTVDKDKSLIGEHVGFAPFPAGPAGARPYNVVTWALGVSPNSTKKEAAWEFIRWVTGKAMVMLTQQGGVPGARRSIWKRSVGTKGFPKELVAVINASASIGVSSDRPLVIQVGAARDAIGDVITAAIENRDVAAAANKANQIFQAIIDKDFGK